MQHRLIFAHAVIAASLMRAAPEAHAQQVTTIITHGFDLDAGQKELALWMFAMGQAIIAESPGGQGAVLRYIPSTGVWQLHSGELAQNEPIVLIFDWVNESDGQFIPGNNIGYAEAAADALYAALRDPRGALTFDPIFNRTVHVIGHSRGCSVNSECVRRLAAAGFDVDQVTTLDPHPVGYLTEDCGLPGTPAWGDPIPQKWSNVTWADNYWRADTNPCDFDGMHLPGVYGIPLHFFLGDDGGVDSTAFPCTLEHTLVHAWYYGTIDTDATRPPDECDIDQASWYDGAESGCFSSSCSGYEHSAMRGGPRPAQPAGQLPGNVPFVYNGRFDLGYSGWLYHGGGGNGDVIAESGTSNWYLRLDEANPFRSHNRFYLPSDAVELRFRLRSFNASANTLVQVRLWPMTGGAHVFNLFPPSPGSAWQTQPLALGPSIPHDETYRIEFALVSTGGALQATIGIDNVEISTGSVSGSDVTLGAITWSEGSDGDGDSVPECGEEAELDVQLCASTTITDTIATLFGGSACASITDSSVEYGTLNGCSSVSGDFDMLVTGCECVATFMLLVEYEKNGVPHSQSIPITRHFTSVNPSIEVCSTHIIITDDCNGNGILESGEDATIRIGLRNAGTAPAFDVEAWPACVPGFDFECGQEYDRSYPDLGVGSACHPPVGPSTLGWDIDLPRDFSGLFITDIIGTYGEDQSFVIPNGIAIQVQPRGWLTDLHGDYSFGVVSIGAIVTVPVTLSNIGSGPAEVTAFTPSSPDTSVSGVTTPFTIAPDASINVTINVNTQGFSCGNIQRLVEIVSTGPDAACFPTGENAIRLSGLVCDGPLVTQIPGANGSDPDIDRDSAIIVWQQGTPLGGDIWAYDIASGTSFVIANQPSEELRPFIDTAFNGDVIVAWSEKTGISCGGSQPPGGIQRDVKVFNLTDNVAMPFNNEATADEEVIGIDPYFILFRRSYREICDPSSPDYAYNMWLYNIETGQQTNITGYTQAGTLSSMRSVGSTGDFGGGTGVWEDSLIFWDGAHGDWDETDVRQMKYQVYPTTCLPWGGACASDAAPVQFMSGFLSWARADSCRIVWHAAPPSTSDDQLFVYSPCIGIMQLTNDKDVTYDSPAISGDFIAYRKNANGPWFFAARRLSDPTEMVIFLDDPQDPWALDQNAVTWRNRSDGTLRFAYLDHQDASVVAEDISVTPPVLYPGDSAKISVVIRNVGPADGSDDILVELYVGACLTGKPVGSETIRGGLPAHGQQQITFPDVTFANSGPQVLCVHLTTTAADNPVNNEVIGLIEVLAPGACCFADGACEPNSTPTGCASLEGSYQGDGTECGNCPDFGACCLSDDSCMDGLTVAQCASQGGQYHGVGSTCASVVCGCPSDLNGDDTTDVNDLLLLIGNWGSCDAPCPPCPGDVNGNCTVDVNDLLLLIGAWGTCP